MPPAPDLQEKIVQMKAALISEAGLKDIDDLDIMDLRTFSLIANRPRQTRSNDFNEAVADKAPAVTGVRKAIVLLVDFSDKTATKTQAHFSDLLFSVGTYATGSMRDFYKEASYNQLDVQGQVAGAGLEPRVQKLITQPTILALAATLPMLKNLQKM
jgi:immune inhibitor A